MLLSPGSQGICGIKPAFEPATDFLSGLNGSQTFKNKKDNFNFKGLNEYETLLTPVHSVNFYCEVFYLQIFRLAARLDSI